MGHKNCPLCGARGELKGPDTGKFFRVECGKCGFLQWGWDATEAVTNFRNAGQIISAVVDDLRSRMRRGVL
jgi:ribosomal protein S27AE